MQKIKIPYKPRTVQKRIHEALSINRFLAIAAHRRFGKTVLSVNHLIKAALTLETYSRNAGGLFGYVAPYLKQAKAVAWENLKYYTAKLPARKINEQELYIEFPNCNRIRLFGADNPDALRGLGFDGVVMDEVAQMRPEVWGEIIQPALSDRMGWALFIGTPKGINLFSEIFYHAEGDETGIWGSMRIDVYGSLATPDPPLGVDEVDRLKGEMSEMAFRREYLCDFSASGDDLLISIEVVADAARRVISQREIEGLPMVFGVDVARFGSDSTCIVRRQGRAVWPPLILQGYSNKTVTERLVSEWHKHKPAAVFIDAGQGQGVIDWAQDLIPNVIEVPFGGKAIEENKFLNRRSEMWYQMREWLEQGGTLPQHEKLKKELSAPVYFYNSAGKIQLEAKEKIKERLGFSPDVADALALTFAQPIAVELALPFTVGADKAVQSSDLWDW